MDLAREAPKVIDLDADLLAPCALLPRRMAVVLRDATEAEDVAQSAFTRALDQRDRFHVGDGRVWLYTIGLRLAFNDLRRRRTHASSRVEGERAQDMMAPIPACEGASGFWRPITAYHGLLVPGSNRPSDSARAPRIVSTSSHERLIRNA